MLISSNGSQIQVLGKQGIRGMAGPDGNPIGTIISYMGKTAPEDYLICDGSVYNVYEYKELADFFEEQFESKYYFGGNNELFYIPNINSSEENIIKCIKAKTSEPYEDIYSEEERVIGRWIDGRPLYRRVCQATSPSKVSTPMDIISIQENIYIINYYGILVYNDSDKNHLSINYINNAANINVATFINMQKHSVSMLVTTAQSTNCTCYVILEYIKTTD